jgi:hypothetical protein
MRGVDLVTLLEGGSYLWGLSGIDLIILPDLSERPSFKFRTWSDFLGLSESSSLESEKSNYNGIVGGGFFYFLGPLGFPLGQPLYFFTTGYFSELWLLTIFYFQKRPVTPLGLPFLFMTFSGLSMILILMGSLSSFVTLWEWSIAAPSIIAPSSFVSLFII